MWCAVWPEPPWAGDGAREEERGGQGSLELPDGVGSRTAGVPGGESPMMLIGTAEDAAVEVCWASLMALGLRLRPRRGSAVESSGPQSAECVRTGTLEMSACRALHTGLPCGIPRGSASELAGTGGDAGVSNCAASAWSIWGSRWCAAAEAAASDVPSKMLPAGLGKEAVSKAC